MPLDKKTLHRITRRGMPEIIAEEEFVRLLQEGKPLRLKMGFDPSRPDIHLGHVVGLRKLRQLQELGHQVILIVGDWTAQIGDPSGQSITRPMLTAEEVRANAETYMRQFFKVVNQEKTQTVWQSEWFGKFTLADVLRLTSKFTVAQILHRDDFWKRWEASRPIAVTELLYPLLQAYDSVMVRADVEFGGTDQKFNLLVGRELQAMMGQRPQQCFLVPILVGTDGVHKMSKSRDNYCIAVDLPPNDMYGKVMSLPDNWFPGLEAKLDNALFAVAPDERPASRPLGPQPTESLILRYFELLTDVPDEELAQMKLDMEGGALNPMAAKKRLAWEIVAQFHGKEAAGAAQRHFERTVQKGEVPEGVPKVEFSRTKPLEGPNNDLIAAVGASSRGPGASIGRPEPRDKADRLYIDLIRLMVKLGVVSSRSEAKRRLEQGAVEIDGKVVKQSVYPITRGETDVSFQYPEIIRVGKLRYVRLVAKD
ncbi:MAG: tyrosine--tRNA ligase [Chloroflexi bacterium]|nr:tyrosine--tRNA ligase [Chloroflexota bacterium]